MPTKSERLSLRLTKGHEAKRFYEHYGFVASPFDPLTMLMLLGHPPAPGARCG